jgi:hypothetical protein
MKTPKFRVFWDIPKCSQIDVDRRFTGACAQGSFIVLVMEAASTSETSVDIDLTTRRYIPVDSEFYNRLLENLKSYNENPI